MAQMSSQQELEEPPSQSEKAMNTYLVADSSLHFIQSTVPRPGNGPLPHNGWVHSISTIKITPHTHPHTTCPEGHLPSGSMILDFVNLKTNIGHSLTLVPSPV